MKKDTRLANQFSDDEYYMNIAIAVRKKANCLGSRVGAIITVEDKIVSTGYNETPQHTKDCLEGGCLRCTNWQNIKSGEDYEICVCVHAEQNALLSAAYFNISVKGGIMYTTMRPCIDCLNSLLLAQIIKVYYLHDWVCPNQQTQEKYLKMQSLFLEGVKRIYFDDPDAQWANSNLRRRALKGNIR